MTDKQASKPIVVIPYFLLNPPSPIALAAVAYAQTDCSRGACYPPTGDLLLGRGQLLHASSTCGLTGSEVFCSPFQLVGLFSCYTCKCVYWYVHTDTHSCPTWRTVDPLGIGWLLTGLVYWLAVSLAVCLVYWFPGCLSGV